MRPRTKIPITGNTEFERFDNFFRAVISVPKAAIDKAGAKWKRAKKGARAT